jgi:hypothetical protein
MCVVSPLSSGSNCAVNSFRLVSSVPSCMSGLLRSTESMACVAHALVITCLAKNTLPRYSDSFSAALLSCSLLHLKRKMSPYTGLRKCKVCQFNQCPDRMRPSSIAIHHRYSIMWVDFCVKEKKALKSLKRPKAHLIACNDSLSKA